MLTHFDAIDIKKVEIFTFRVPITTPVCTSFGTMHNRPAVLLRVEDKDGAYGYGEAWCNFPSCGAEHRARLLETVIAPLLLHNIFASPAEAFTLLSQKVHVLALQANEPGPLAQAVAAADIALWDLCSRKASLPLFRALGGKQPHGQCSMPAYASGINPSHTARIVQTSRDAGYRAFKCKVGFHVEQDICTVREVLDGLNQGESLAIDANQAFDLPTALRFAAMLNNAPLQWLEEPLRCDTHLSQWKILRDHCSIPLAGGENIRSAADFEKVIFHRALAVIQPDICKWGGLSATLPIAQKVIASGLRYCPHYLGGGIGLLASAHLLAAVGGDGLLEVDINENPLREMLAQPYPALRDGRFLLNEQPGLGVDPDMAELTQYITFQCQLA